MVRWKTAIVLPLLAALLLCICYAGQIGQSDIYYSRATTELNFWGRQDYRPQPARISRVQRSIGAALAGWPGNPDYLQARASLLMWQASWEEQPAQVEELRRQAIASVMLALARRPAHLRSWLTLAGDKARAGQNDATWHLAIEKLKILSAGRQAANR